MKIAVPGPISRDVDDAPKLRFCPSHVGIGMALSAVLMAAIPWADAQGLGRLLLPCFFCALALGAARPGGAIMLRFAR